MKPEDEVKTLKKKIAGLKSINAKWRRYAEVYQREITAYREAVLLARKDSLGVPGYRNILSCPCELAGKKGQICASEEATRKSLKMKLRCAQCGWFMRFEFSGREASK